MRVKLPVNALVALALFFSIFVFMVPSAAADDFA